MTTIVNTRETFDRQLRKLKDDLLVLGNMVEQAALDAAKALKTRDFKTAQRIYDADQWINEKRLQIENDCVALIATQQPMARDVRFLASALEISTELERMGDYAKGIARICLLLKDAPDRHPTVEISQMAQIASAMLHKALRAFVNTDIETARAIPQEDDAVDALYNQFHHQLIQKMIGKPESIDRTNYLLWAAHNLERLADRVTNICERTVYVGTGVLQEMENSDDESLIGLSEPQQSIKLKTVLVLCTGNSARSHLAEALINARLGDRWHAVSAGTDPAGYVHPLALRVLSEAGIQHEGRSKSVDEFRDATFDVVITVCDDAAENCPVWLGPGKRVHIGFPDPAKAAGTEEEKLAVFRQVRDGIAEQVLGYLESWD